MKLYCFILISISYCAKIYAQNLTIPERSIPITHTDYSEWVLVYNDDVKTSKLENDKTYYWLKAKHIHSSKGGYEGNLLHGEYTALYKDNSLKEKGTFYKGLKSGEWKTWHPNGELMQINHWRKGKLSGTVYSYDIHGNATKKENYKNGLKHGSQITYTDSIPAIHKFRHGKELIPKTKKVKNNIQKGSTLKEQPKEENKTEEIEPVKNPEKKKRYKRHKSKEEPKKETKEPKTKKTDKNKIEKA